jgi:hypothetical protein
MLKLLTEAAVEDLISVCLLAPSEMAGPAVGAYGPRTDFSFHPDRLRDRKGIVAQLLLQLPSDFHQSAGGGASWRLASVRRDGSSWTSRIDTVERLLCLGVAAKLARWLDHPATPVSPGGAPPRIVVFSE